MLQVRVEPTLRAWFRQEFHRLKGAGEDVTSQEDLLVRMKQAYVESKDEDRRSWPELSP